MKYPNCKCTYCNKELGEFTLETFVKCFKGEDKNGKRKLFCNEKCYNEYKKQFVIEVYNSHPIYAVKVDGEMRYMSYWFSNYYFTDIKNCRNIIDHPQSPLENYLLNMNF